MPINRNASEVISFLEDHFLLEDGKPIMFEQWQKESVLTPVFERTRHSWDTFLVGLPKKNGKSTLGSALSAYALLFDDPNPEVYSAAGDLDQARIIFQSTEKALKRSDRTEFLVQEKWESFYTTAIGCED
jgi:phage terminase large subunit-like protein